MTNESNIPPTDDPRVSAYLLDELDGDERDAFEVALAESPALQKLLHETRETIECLRLEFADSEVLALTAEQRAAISAQLDAAGSRQDELPADAGDQRNLVRLAQKRRTRDWSKPVAGLSLLALLALVLAAILFPGQLRVPHGSDPLAKRAADAVKPEVPGIAAGKLLRGDTFRETEEAVQSSSTDFRRESLLEEINEDVSSSSGEVAQEGASRHYGIGQSLDGRTRSKQTNTAVSNSGYSGLGDQTTELSTATDNGALGVDRASVVTTPASGPATTSEGVMSPFSESQRSVGFDFDDDVDAKRVDEIKLNESTGFQLTKPTVENLRYEALGGGGAGGADSGMQISGAGNDIFSADATVPLWGAAGGSQGKQAELKRRLEKRRGLTTEAEPVRSDGFASSTPRAEPLSQISGGGTDAFGREAPATDRGRGAGRSGDKFDLIVENEFLRVTDAPLSTFSIDVDTASYAKIRMHLNERNQLPRPDAVRIEELINYFPYDYTGPQADEGEESDPFAAHQEVVICPWNPQHRLVRIGLKGREIEHDARPKSNLVFLLDVSGSMDQPNKLPLLKRGMKMLADQLGENDRVAIAVYAGAAGMVLDSTTGDQKATIVGALSRLAAGGSTNGGAGIQLAYQTALDNFIQGGVNRVILCTDGDFNVGTTGTDQLVRIVEENAKAGVFLSVLGFGMGNHNDSMLEQISNKGNGNYAFVDTDSEAHKVLVEQMSGTLVTIAKDVKIQIEFNPARVAAYRLIGYENRILAAQDFNDDKKDAGEIGAGHTVTALYEVVPMNSGSTTAPPIDPLKYQTPFQLTEEAAGRELLTLKLRYKQPDGNTSRLLTFPLADAPKGFHQADRDLQFAAAVASFGMLLRNSQYSGNASYAAVLEMATPAAKDDSAGYRREFLHLVRKAAQLCGESTGEGR